jgi:translation initiation factor 2 alpha subunit (eIF-2alpha)
MIISNKKFPSLNEYVLCKVIKYVDLNDIKGAYCQLIHYNNINALLLPSEATRNKYQRIEKIHKIGNEIVCEVYNIDGHHIDLSYKSVSEEIEKEQKEKMVYLEKLWKIVEKINHLYMNYSKIDSTDDFIKESLFFDKKYYKMELSEIKIKYNNYLLNPMTIFDDNNFEETFINYCINEIEINKYIQITPYSISIEFELYSINMNGLENIKKVLHNVFDEIKDKYEGRLELHSLPTYNIIYNIINEEEIINIMNTINNNLIKESNACNCIVKVNTNYKIIHQRKFNLLL